jgi:CRP-like cAMP-binding protein
MTAEEGVMAKRLATTRRRPSTRLPLPGPNGVRNHLLAALPADEYERVAATIDVVPLNLKHVVHKAGESIQHVYFPGGVFCSVLTTLEDGGMVEVATIGREGMVGVSAMLDGTPPSSTSIVQGETNACYRMTVNAFRKEMERRGAFSELIARYTHALFGFVMQSTACNAVHSVEQRLARWLLMAQDRMENHEFVMTQEFAAMMLGATRPTVTVVAGTLQKAGLITYHRGHITVVRREKLQAASCECYRTTTRLLQAVTDGQA